MHWHSSDRLGKKLNVSRSRGSDPEAIIPAKKMRVRYPLASDHHLKVTRVPLLLFLIRETPFAVQLHHLGLPEEEKSYARNLLSTKALRVFHVPWFFEVMNHL